MISSIKKHKNKTGTISRFIGKSKKDLLFCLAMLAFPIAQFVVFYIVVNANSILLAFKSYDREGNVFVWTYFSNFERVFKDLVTNQNMLSLIKNSFLTYFVSTFIGITLVLLFSFYVYKKMPGSKLFGIVLYMPAVISAIVMVILFQYFVDRALPELFSKILNRRVEGLLANPDTTFGTVLFFNIWVSFGTSVIIYSNAMGNIDESIVESARMDGATGFKEFIHISLPMIFPTLSTFLVVGIAGIFNNQLCLFSFFGDKAAENIQTFGYFFYRRVAIAGGSQKEFPYLSAMGLILTSVSIPVTFLVKNLLERLGPKVD